MGGPERSIARIVRLVALWNHRLPEDDQNPGLEVPGAYLVKHWLRRENRREWRRAGYSCAVAAQYRGGKVILAQAIPAMGPAAGDGAGQPLVLRGGRSEERTRSSPARIPEHGAPIYPAACGRMKPPSFRPCCPGTGRVRSSAKPPDRGRGRIALLFQGRIDPSRAVCTDVTGMRI